MKAIRMIVYFFWWIKWDHEFTKDECLLLEELIHKDKVNNYNYKEWANKKKVVDKSILEIKNRFKIIRREKWESYVIKGVTK